MAEDMVQRIQETLERAKAGSSRAQYELGWLYVQTRDYFIAYRWLALAFDGRVEEAIEATEYMESSELVTYAEIRIAYFEIGCWCEEGAIVPRDLPAAVRLWEVSAQMGHPEASRKLQQYR